MLSCLLYEQICDQSIDPYQIRIIRDTHADEKPNKKKKPHRGYAFIVFEREKDMRGNTYQRLPTFSTCGASLGNQIRQHPPSGDCGPQACPSHPLSHLSSSESLQL